MSASVSRVHDDEIARLVPDTDSLKAIRSAIAHQLGKLEKDADRTATSNFELAQRWEFINLALGLCAVGVSGIVTVLGAVSSAKGIDASHENVVIASTILASIATVLGSVLTFLKPSERAGRYREFGNKQKALRNRIRIYREVELLEKEDSNKNATAQLRKFLAEKNSLNSDNPPIPKWAHAAARKSLDARSPPQEDVEARHASHAG